MTSEQADYPEELKDIPRDFFRRGTGKYSDIILLPQPTDSPNDPLNVSSFWIAGPPDFFFSH